MRRNAVYARNLALNADTDLTKLEAIELGATGYLGLSVVIDNGAGGAPSDTPAGTWELQLSADGATFAAITSSSITSQLAALAPNANTVVRGFAAFRGLPGTHAKLRYRATSGGAGNSRATIIAITEP